LQSDEDFEQVLSDLEEQIKQSQARLTNLRTQERRASTVLLMVMGLIYVISALCYFLYLQPGHTLLETVLNATFLWAPGMM
jgi:hypothetical protein